MMRWSILVGAALVSLAGLARAETPAAPLRDPFWPVGYVGRAAPQQNSEGPQSLLDLSRLSPEEQAIIKAHLRVGGILEQGARRFAIINADVVAEGDVLKLEVDNASYRFLIRSLQPANIVLEPLQSQPSE